MKTDEVYLLYVGVDNVRTTHDCPNETQLDTSERLIFDGSIYELSFEIFNEVA